MERGGKKKSGKEEDSQMVVAAKEEVLPGYEEYLVLLQERNKLLKRLRKKNKSQIELERKEQGFSLYVNGPHQGAKPVAPGSKATIPTQPKTARKPKTAGDAPRNANILDNKALEDIAREEMEKQRELDRAKTAPNARERRRNWNVQSVEIKTTQGGKKVKAPEILTGRYADDFESDENSDQLRSSASENSEDESPPQRNYRKPLRKPPPPRESDLFNSSDSVNSEDDQTKVSQHMSAVLEDDSDDELEIDAAKFNKKSNVSPRKVQKSNNKGREQRNDSDDEGHSEKLMLSMRELQKLRYSLANHATIRESLARDASSDDESFVPESPIPEVEEDLPTDDSTSFEESPGRNINLQKPRMKPDDTIVLEFGGAPPINKKVEKNLSAARRKDIDEVEYMSGLGRQRPGSEKQNREPVKITNRSQSARSLMSSENQVKKSVRPLSANRRTPDSAWKDPDTEASAVMAALRAENEQASKFNKDEKQTPRKKPTPKAARDSLVKPLYDKSEMPPKSHQMRQSESPRQSVDVSQCRPLVSGDKIEQIMERVLKMTPKHQRRLVKMLGKIEQSVVTESVDIPEEKPQAKQRKSVDGPVKAIRRSIVKKSPSVNSNDDNVVEVQVEIKSNWGHAMRLGLTEIQIYDRKNSLVPISATDVTVHGAEECKGTIDLLFNGKFKSNKERNMWSCRYHARRPVEISIIARNRYPGSDEKFSLSQMKIWNFNKSINELDIGVKDVRVFVGGDLVFNGPVEKGCGNQVFDYCHIIPLVQQTQSVESSPTSDRTEKSQSPEVEYKQQSQPHKSSSRRETTKGAIDSYSKKSNKLRSKNRENGNFSSRNIESGSNISRDSLSTPGRESFSRPPISAKGERSPSPSPRFAGNMQSPRGHLSANHRSISPSPNQERKKTFRSISMSSQSSASSGCESQPNSRPTSGIVTSSERDKPARSETRVLNHPTVSKNVPYGSYGSDSQSESEDYIRDGPSKGSTPAKRRGVKTPKKSKRMAARLDGHNSTDVESSRSVSESSEQRPPLPQRKSEEKLVRKALVQKPTEEKAKKQPLEQGSKNINKPKKNDTSVENTSKVQESESELDDTLKAQGTVSSSVSVASSISDDVPMLQKLKDMNKKDQGTTRKKDIPRWLKAEGVTEVPFESPAESRDLSSPEPLRQEAPKAAPRENNRSDPRRQEAPRVPPTEDEINMLIDEEMALFPEQRKAAGVPEPTVETAEEATPMQRIQSNRSKWRENPSMNLEESWGSLSQFNKSQRGRLSLDMDDDVLDEYINKAAKMAGLPSEPPIQEEAVEQDVDVEPSMNVDSDDDGFVIPELPYGRELVINIRTTWGDKHYVGFTGLEVFSSTGEQINITKIRADPSDINILPEYNKDPRVVNNLIDGVNRTRDDIHMWLAPFVTGRDHLVFATFEKPCKIALIRIWNYNKSRIHSYRGVKDVYIGLDSSVIFKGEIARACGGTEGGTEAFGDTILFTMDEVILEAVSQNDEAYEGEMLSDDEPFDVERPATADSGGRDERPFTRAVGNVKQLERERTAVSPTPEFEGDMMVYKGKCIELNFTATWGDHHYMGLTGLEIVGKDGEALPVTMNMVTADPWDVRSLPGHERDDRTLDKVIDGTNVTMSDEHMWLIPFNSGQNHTFTIDFGEKVLMAGLRLWNYNKSKEDTYRGARTVHVAIDSKTISPPDGYLVRKGPGNCHFDFAQEVSFSPVMTNPGAQLSALGSGSGTDESNNYEVVQMPCGFIYQLQLFGTWGDVYYVGLNGIELYDANLKKIQLTESNISAFPDSVNVLEQVHNDVRTPDKLIDGFNDTMDGGHAWLAPVLPSMLNRVYIIFDQPTTISMIKIWNYSKTPNRGAKDFALLVDDLLVYNGVLQSVTKAARGILPNCEAQQSYHTILFTNNKDMLKKEKHTILNNASGEQDVQMTNDKKIVSHYNDPKKAQSGKPVDQKLRPTTSVVHSKKRR